MSLRIVLVGAVWSTRAALKALADAGHRPARLITLPVDKASRHSDFVDLAPLADQLGVPVTRALDVNSDELLASLRALAPDIVLVIGWSRFCHAEFRAIARIGTLGYHPTPLPRLRGRAALAWTILLGLERSAGTLFWLDEGVDSGPIAAQEAFDLTPDMTLTELIALHESAIARMVGPLFDRLAAGEIPARPQDEAEATYAAVRRPGDGEIDWTQSADRIERLVRAASRPYPGAFTTLNGQKLVVWAARVVLYPQWTAQTGQVFTYADGAPIVRCGAGTDLALTDYEIVTAAGEPAGDTIRGQPRFGR